MELATYFKVARPATTRKTMRMSGEFRREGNNTGPHFSILFHLFLTGYNNIQHYTVYSMLDFSLFADSHIVWLPAWLPLAAYGLYTILFHSTIDQLD